MAFEPAVVRSWVRTQLLASSSVTAVFGQRIHPDPVPQGTVAPFVAHGLQSGRPDYLLNRADHRLWTTILWRVRAVAPSTTFAVLNSGSEAIRVALDGKGGTAGGGEVFICMLDEILEQTPTVDGVQYLEQIQLYRVAVK